MKQTMIAGTVVVLVAGAVAAGCGGKSTSAPAESTAGTTTESSGGGGGQAEIAGVMANDHGTKTASGETKVELDDFYFEPTVIKGKPGQKVTLELENEGSTAHTFTIDSQSVDQTLQPGKDAKVTVMIPKSGAVSFYCSFHRNEGMAGALVANGSSPSSGSTGTTTDDNGGGGGGDGY